MSEYLVRSTGHVQRSCIQKHFPCRVFFGGIKAAYNGVKETHDDVIKWKHFPRNWPFVRGIHRFPVNSPHKGQWRGALMFSLICAGINDWVNNREAGDLRRHRAHDEVIVMRSTGIHLGCWWPRTLISSEIYGHPLGLLLRFSPHGMIARELGWPIFFTVMMNRDFLLTWIVLNPSIDK